MEKIHLEYRDEQIQADFKEELTRERFIVYSKFCCKTNKDSFSSRKKILQPVSRLASLFNEPKDIVGNKLSKEKIHIVQSILPSLKKIRATPSVKRRFSQCKRNIILSSKQRSGSMHRFYSYFLNSDK